MSDELRWHPESDDPAFAEGDRFLQRNLTTSDGVNRMVPYWHGWFARQAFWCGVKWARENPMKEVDNV